MALAAFFTLSMVARCVRASAVFSSAAVAVP
jgi:hypothetical protein